jgi:Ca-activated chloride channel family protein
MTFIWGDLLWLLFLIPVLVAAYLLLQRRRRKYALRYASLSIMKDAMGKGPGFRRHIPPILFLAGLCVILAGLARPAAYVITASQQGTVILTFDVSGSMGADDINPTRLEAAKAAARLFVAKQPPKVRIGIVAFSDDASIVQGPTIDHQVVLAAINRLVPQGRTAVGSAIVTSLKAVFEDSNALAAATTTIAPLGQPIPQSSPTPAPVAPGSYTSAVIVLLSDGQSNAGKDPLEVVSQAADKGVRIYTVGLGSTQGTIVNVNGSMMRVSLDEAALTSIAQRTAGQYFKAESANDLSSIYEKLSTRLVIKPELTEITALFAGFAALIMVVGGVLSLLWFNRLP